MKCCQDTSLLILRFFFITDLIKMAENLWEWKVTREASTKLGSYQHAYSKTRVKKFVDGIIQSNLNEEIQWKRNANLHANNNNNPKIMWNVIFLWKCGENGKGGKKKRQKISSYVSQNKSHIHTHDMSCWVDVMQICLKYMMGHFIPFYSYGEIKFMMSGLDDRNWNMKITIASLSWPRPHTPHIPSPLHLPLSLSLCRPCT